MILKRVGITGNNGFIGKHLENTIKLFPNEFLVIPFERDWFLKEKDLDAFVVQCDVVIHLAAMNRHEDPKVLFDININLVKNLANSLKRINVKPHVIISSSTQEIKDNLYGKSKLIGRNALIKWAESSSAIFTGLIIPNVFGPFCKPNYNSVVATFCYKIVNNEPTQIDIDSNVDLIYVGDLIEKIIEAARTRKNESYYKIEPSKTIKVSELLKQLISFNESYQIGGEIPFLKDNFELQLFNTFRSYIDIDIYFPKKYIKHKDERGEFVEIIKTGIGGQSSFSTTRKNVTRGNHFHTRKIERFAVIKGRALIQLRKIGEKKVFEFILDGKDAAYVDIPIWYTHNIKNIGEEDLYTNFWINEPYNPMNPDTYFENVVNF